MFEKVKSLIARSGVRVARSWTAWHDEQRRRARPRRRGRSTPSVGDERQHQRGRDDHDAVDDDLAERDVDALHDRQHRDAGRRVVVAVADRQRPEVRRRPEEDHREHHPRRRRERSPVTAAQPTSTGTAPAAPPITMFCGLRGFSQIVYTNT